MRMFHTGRSQRLGHHGMYVCDSVVICALVLSAVVLSAVVCCWDE